jgi:hypothetical protein
MQSCGISGHPSGELVSINLVALAQCDAGDGSNPEVTEAYPVPSFLIDMDLNRILIPPIVGQGYFGSGDIDHLAPAVFINTGNGVAMVDPTGRFPTQTYQLPTQNSRICTGLAVDASATFTNAQGQTEVDRVLWFGDSQAVLYQVRSRGMSLVASYPATDRQVSVIFTTPILYMSNDPNGKTSNEQLTVVFRLFDLIGGANLYGLDPTNGILASIPTSFTQITTLTHEHTNDVVYAAGALNIFGSLANQTLQVFGVRVDQLPQALRAFIIESQAMVDYDVASPTTPVARYQTHLTVVDNQKSPQPYEAVKIWADQPNT